MCVVPFSVLAVRVCVTVKWCVCFCAVLDSLILNDCVVCCIGTVSVVTVTVVFVLLTHLLFLVVLSLCRSLRSFLLCVL